MKWKTISKKISFKLLLECNCLKKEKLKLDEMKKIAEKFIENFENYFT